MTITEMTAKVQGLTAEQCPFTRLHQRGTMILCPDHRLDLDADGDLWCQTCDTGSTRPQLMSCPCADLPTGQPW